MGKIEYSCKGRVDDTTMIVVKISDGLGNQLFQYAYARILQEKVKQQIYLDISDINRISYRESEAGKLTRLCDMREYQLSYFCITLPVIDEKRIAQIYKRKPITNKFLKYCDALRLLPTVYLNEAMCNEDGFSYSKWQNYYVEGFFFDKKYYEKEAELLTTDFRLKKQITIPEKIQRVLTDRNTVSLHVRRGDFLKLGHDISKSNYYERAINYFEDKVRSPFLFVFSDDTEWVKKNMKFNFEHLFVSDYKLPDYEELALMSMCKNNIIANSTFSYWGAWLNLNKEKIVVAPRGWRPKIIPDTWVQL